MSFWRTLIERVTGNASSAGRLCESEVIDAIHQGPRQAGVISSRDPSMLGSIKQSDGSLPVPPDYLRVGTDSVESYLERAAATGAQLQSTMRDHGFGLDSGQRLLDWGCSTGRIIRTFQAFADEVEIWGNDQIAEAIAWNKQYLSPPFHFVTGTCLPHLPFPDQYFDAIYGISVFTHIDRLVDAWLLELRRTMKPNGLAIFTVHDEHSIEFWRTHRPPFWIPKAVDLGELEKHEITVVHGKDWGHVFTIFRSDWIRQEWGRYFDVIEIIPRFERAQSAVVLRKRPEVE